MKQKILRKLILIAVLSIGTHASAHDFEVDGIFYTVTDNTATVTFKGSSYNEYINEYTGSVTIPESVTYDGTTYSVTTIGYMAFEFCKDLTSITIPNSVTTIGDYAFLSCTGLTDITIPNSVTTIGSEAFNNCNGLTNITIPNSVTSIDGFAFAFCTGLTSITIPNSVTSIGDAAFGGCDGLTSIFVESDNPKYDSRDNCNAIIETATNTLISGCITTVIPNSVTSIGDYAFGGCTDLKNVIIPNTVTSIGSQAFDGCYNLTSVSLPNSVTTIGDRAFRSCNYLTNLTFPISVTSIGEYAFQGCYDLTSVTSLNPTPPTCKTDVFKNVNTQNITLSVPAESVELYASADTWKGFGTIVAAEPEASDLYYNIISDTEVEVIAGETKYTGDIVIPSKTTIDSKTYTVTTIGEEAFYECTGLTSVTIPNSVTTIGEKAFLSCTGLTDITIPNSVTTIGYQVFYECRGLTSITIPNSVTSIGKNAFYDCTGLTSIRIPNSVTSIDNSAFISCFRLTSIVVESGNTVYDSRDNCNAIIETATNTLIYGCKTTLIPSSVTSIGESAFQNCGGLTSVTIPNSVTTIGKRAFAECGNLTSVTIPSSVTCIQGGIFFGCFGLTSIIIESGNTIYDSRDNCNAIIETATNTLIYGCKTTVIPNSVTSIGDGAFDRNYGLTSVTIPNSVTSIGNSAFFCCRNLTSVTIPNSVTSIGNNAFAYCTGLTSVTIPNSVTSIGESAFDDCSGLTSVSIPNSVTSIGSRAFSGCTGLTSVSIPNSVTSIGRSLFSDCTGLTSIIVESGNTVYDSRDNCNAIIETATNTLISGCKTTVIPNSVTSIGDFAFDGCYNLTSVTSLNPTPPTCGYNVFLSVDIKNLTLYVPAGSVEFYASADTWKGFGTIVGLESETPVEYGFEAEDITTLHNRTIDLPVSLINAGDVSAFQFDIYLPEGISIAIDEDEEYEMTLNQDRATSSHSVFTLKQPNGAIRYACYSTKSSAFKGESGTTLFTIPLTIAENLEGEYKVIIKDIILSSSDAQGYNCQDVEINITVKPYDYGDSNGDGNINIVDVVNTMNVVLGKDSARFIEEAADINADGQINIVDVVGTMNLVLGYTRTATPTSILKQISKKSATEESVYIEDFSICATESKIIDLNMTNNQAYSAIQFDIVMPEGLTIDYDENEEEYLFESTDRFTKSHSINSNQLSENTIRVGIYSTKSKDFTANEGALIRIPFTASEDMAAGEYKVEIKGIVLSTSDSQGVYLPDTQATLIVYPATMTDVEETLYDVDVEYYNLQGVKVAKENLTNGVYVKKVGTNSTKVFIK